MAIHASPAASDAIDRLLRVIDTDLVTALETIRTEGSTLSSPANWDGGAALKWRDNFDRVEGGARNLLTELREIQSNARVIVKAIEDAGGGYGGSGAA